MKKDIGYRMCLDELFTSDYYYTEFDVGGEGHYITIDADNLEVFLDAFAKEWRNRAEQALRQVVLEDYV